jgi:urea transporter
VQWVASAWLARWGMELQRWFNSGQPQTLQLAQILLYTNAAIELLGGLFVGQGGVFWLPIVVGQVFAAHGIANGRRSGYRLAVVFAFLPVALLVLLYAKYHVVALGIFNLLFTIALIAAVMHPQSREYQRIWFS